MERFFSCLHLGLGEARDVGDSERIGGVVGFGDIGETEEDFEGVLDLEFFGSSTSTDAFFDLEGSVFVDRDTTSCDRVHDDPTALGDVDDGSLIAEEEELFYPAGIWFVHLDEFTQIPLNIDELECCIELRSGVYHPKIQNSPLRTHYFEHSKTDRRRTRIDSENN